MQLLHQLLSLLVLSSSHSWSVLADTTLFQSSDYASGSLGMAPVQTFKSSSSTPAIWNFVVPFNDSTSGLIEPGLVFIAPRGTDVKTPGALIYDKNGDLIWDGTQYGATMTFRIAEYKGEPVIILWTGSITGNGVGSGHDLLLNNKYQVIANFTADLDDGTLCDFHDADITSNNTALLTAYPAKSWDLSSFGISNGFLLDSVAQEIDIDSGKAIFSWVASDHVDVTGCYADPGTSGTSQANAWDFFHINSIDKDSKGNYLISSRHCHTLYYVSPSGDVLWTLGGKNSSVTMNDNTGFGWQHDARWRNNETQISIFDNAGTSWEQDSTNSRAIFLDYDASGNSVTLAQELLPFNLSVSESQGNVDLLNSSNILVGWGQMPYFSEFNSAGQFLYAVQFGVGDVQSYRAYHVNWTAAPTTRPSVFVEADDSNTTVYVSWNGATEVDTWQLSGSTAASPQLAVPLSNTSRSGFETQISASNTSFQFYQVAAFNSNKKVLAYSNFTASDGSSHDPADNQTVTVTDNSNSSSSSNGSGSSDSNSAVSLSFVVDGRSLASVLLTLSIYTLFF